MRLTKTVASLALFMLALGIAKLEQLAAEPSGKQAAAGGTSQTDHTQPTTSEVKEDSLQVLAEAPKGPVKLKQTFNVRLRVVNQSNKPQSFRVMNCSWDEHWKSSNKQVVAIGWECAKNFAVVETLEPNQVYEKSLGMQLEDGRPGEKVSFNMGFTPIGSDRTYWSQNIEVESARQ